MNSMASTPEAEFRLRETRRHFFGRGARGVGVAALGSLLGRDLGQAVEGTASPSPLNGVLKEFHVPPKAKRVIYLFQSGAPSQQDLFDHKPLLQKHFGEDMRDHFEMTQRITGMTANQSTFPLAGTKYAFSKHGQSGMEISELLPHISGIADDICLVRSMHTEAINHDPAITYIQTGSQIPGRPSLGAWLSYGLGSENENLPAFVVLNSTWSAKRDAQALFSRLWGSGFLPSKHQGVALRSKGDPVLYLSNPQGVSPEIRRAMLDGVQKLNQRHYQQAGDPETQARIAQYEMAFRMQTSVPDLTDLSTEPDHIFDLYGPESRKPGTYAYNCLLARRLAERGVRFTQIFIRGWDQHGNLTGDLPLQCGDVDRASWALVQDLKMRGMLDDTLIVWGGEFGRTIYCQGGLSPTNYGRDHHPRCFSMWFAGGGIKGGANHGETDDFSYNIVQDPVHIHDLNATILHLLGIDHERISAKHLGLDVRLTGVEKRHIVQPIIA
ncbi:MAG: DUF1501 domain-containing protein [Verrucomicrobiae bacterium]|nr:DUF1501 domain-containing protein [Verrucomicrobiae bacterium]